MVFILFPFYWTFVTSVKPQDELYGAVVTYWPGRITFEAYSKLFTTTVNFFLCHEEQLYRCFPDNYRIADRFHAGGICIFQIPVHGKKDFNVYVPVQ